MLITNESFLHGDTQALRRPPMPPEGDTQVLNLIDPWNVGVVDYYEFH